MPKAEKQALLDELQYAIFTRLENTFVGDLIANPDQVEVALLTDFLTDDVVLSVRFNLTGREAGEFCYPADWWQAFKNQFFPYWARRRWPVKMAVVKLAEIYPDVALPNERRLIVAVDR